MRNGWKKYMKIPKNYEKIKAWVVYDPYWKVTSEYTSLCTKCSVQEVEQSFAIMNIEGLLSQAIRPFYHFKGDWVPNTYEKTNKCQKLAGFQYREI